MSLSEGQILYVVQASRGEYSDRLEWPVAAYENEDDAEADCERLNALQREIKASRIAWRKGIEMPCAECKTEMAALAGDDDTPEMVSEYEEMQFWIDRIAVRLRAFTHPAACLGTGGVA